MFYLCVGERGGRRERDREKDRETETERKKERKKEKSVCGQRAVPIPGQCKVRKS